jgi:DNA-binding LytR/AlgR family response regulator
VLLHCGDRSYPMRQTLSGLAAQLDPAQFVRVHRTAVVNIAEVRSFQDSGDLRLDLLNGTSVPVSRSCLPALKQALTMHSAHASQP